MVKINKSIIIFSMISIFILMVLFNKLLFGNYKFIGPDALSPAAIAQGIESVEDATGEYPLWMPWIFSGLPSTHSFQNISKYYLPHNIIQIFENLGLARIWNYIFHFIFGGIGVFLLLKRLKSDTYSAIFGGIAFMLTPYLITMVVHGHGSQMMTSVYIPWMIWGVHLLKTNPNLRNLGIFSLIVGLQLQRAHVQIAYYTWMLVGLYLLIQLIQKSKNKEIIRNKWFIYVLIGLIIGMGMALCIYLPALEYAPYSIRGAGSGGGTGFEYATQWSFSFKEVSTFILPSVLGFGGPTYWGNMPFTDYPNYMGILVLIFAIFGAIKSKWEDSSLFILGGFFALLLSFGKNFSLLYGMFYDFFPYFNKFRVPAMFLIITQFCTAMLAGLGFTHLKHFVNEKFTLEYIRLIIIGLITTFIIYFIFGKNLIKSLILPIGAHPKLTQVRLEMIQLDVWMLFLYLGAFVGVLWCWKKRLFKWNIVVIVTIIIMVFDLSFTDTRIIEPKNASLRSKTLYSSRIKKQYLNMDEIIQYLKNDTTNFRIFPVGKLANENRWAAFQIESIMGYHPAKLDNYNKLISNVGLQYPGVLQMLNVKYLISLEPLNHPLFKQVFQGMLYYKGKKIKANIYEYTKFLPRAYFVNKLRNLVALSDQYKFLQHKEFSPINESFIEADLGITEFSQINRELKILDLNPNEIILETISENNQFLILSEIYYQGGWKAYIDNEETKILKVNTVLRGINIPPGIHRIQFLFDPFDLRLGLIISIFSTLIAFGLIGKRLFLKNNVS